MAHGFGPPHGNSAKQVGFDQSVGEVEFAAEQRARVPAGKSPGKKKLSWIHANVSKKNCKSVLIASMKALMTERVASAAAASAAVQPHSHDIADYVRRAQEVVLAYCTCLSVRIDHAEGCAAAGKEEVRNESEDAVLEMRS